MKVADAVIRQLEAWGVKEIYGLAGSTILPLIERLERESSIRYVGVADERSAAIMASAEAKLTGHLGVCLSDAGPGAASLAAGLFDAHMDRVPVLALTGQIPTRRIGTDYRQSADLTQIFAGAAGCSAQVAAADQAGELLAQVLRYAATSSDSAHLALPEDLLDADYEGPGPVSRQSFLPPRPALDRKAIGEAAQLLADARRPVILMGRGAAPQSARVLELARRLQAPVITSLFAKGALSEADPLVVGPLGEAGSDEAAQAARSADLLLVLGSTWWPQAFLPQRLPVIQIDRRPGAFTVACERLLGIAADLQEALPELLQALPQVSAEPLRRGQGRQEYREDSPGLHPARIMLALREVLPQGAVVCLDTGLSTLWYGRAFPARSETTLCSGRWRTLGFALPAAIAAKIARPDASVVAIAGDGGFRTSMHEFSTLAQQDLPIAILVLRNGLLGEERARQQQSGYEGVHAMALRNPDFTLFARAYGGEGLRAETAAELSQALRQAFSTRRPVLIDIQTVFSAPQALQPLQAAAR